MLAWIRAMMVKREKKEDEFKNYREASSFKYLAIDWMCGVRKRKGSEQHRFVT